LKFIKIDTEVSPKWAELHTNLMNNVPELMEGKNCKNSIKILQEMIDVVQGSGSDEEWSNYFYSNDYESLTSLLPLFSKSMNVEVGNDLGMLFALLSQIVNDLWYYLLPDHEYVIETTIEFCLHLIELPKSEVRVGGKKKEGEENGKKDGEEEEDDYGYDTEDEEKENDEPEEDEGMDGVSIWLLVLNHIFGGFAALEKLPSQVEEDEMVSFANALLEIIAKERSRRFSTAITTLLTLNYLHALLLETTENPILQAILDRKENSSEFLEGFFVEMNEYSYPAHDQPEASHAQQMALDLLYTPESAGFFFPNDLNVMIDILLTNIGALSRQDVAILPYLECIYLLLINSEWAFHERYRRVEIAKMLEDIISHSCDVLEDVCYKAEQIMAECVDVLE